MDEIKNSILAGDCRDILKEFPDECFDVICIDPPFFSKMKYDIVWDNGAELAAYDDTGMYTAENTIDERRFEERVKDTMKAFESGLKGHIAGIDIPKAKILKDMDVHVRKEVRKDMQGRISRGGMDNYLEFMRLRLLELHRVLKSTGTIFLHCDKHANHHLRLMLDDIFGAKNFLNEIIWYYKRWTNDSGRFQQMHDNIYWYSKTNKYTYNMQYQSFSEKTAIAKYKRKVVDGRVVQDKDNLMERDVEKGVAMHDVWVIPFLHPMSKERLGYDTQKPEVLLERIILAASNEGDLILDAFVGGGTTAVVAERLKRRWVGIDVSRRACLKTIENLTRYDVPESSYEINFDKIEERIIVDKVAKLAKLKWKETEELIRKTLGFEWTTNCKSYGIDGQHIEDKDYFLEVKKWKSRVGQATVEKFYGKMQRRKASRGIIVADGFTLGAVKAARTFREKGIDIELKEIESLVREGLL